MKATIELAMRNPSGRSFLKEVEGKVFGAWAAHESSIGFGYRVTFLRFGLAVPYDFDTQGGAEAAAKKINAIRPDWDALSPSDIKAEGAAILSICKSRRGIMSEGPKGDPVPVSELRGQAA